MLITLSAVMLAAVVMVDPAVGLCCDLRHAALWWDRLQGMPVPEQLVLCDADQINMAGNAAICPTRPWPLLC